MLSRIIKSKTVSVFSKLEGHFKQMYCVTARKYILI